jgi:hypothetical protein
MSDNGRDTLQREIRALRVVEIRSSTADENEVLVVGSPRSGTANHGLPCQNRRG